MKIFFDPEFDSGAWPGPLGGKNAAFGEAWLGPVGMIDLLENQLGLTGKYLSNTERALQLVKPLQTKDGFWSKSASVDPLGTARKILHWRDELTLCGWEGEGRAPRLRNLAAITQDIPAGLPDRLVSITQCLSKRSIDVRQIGLFTPTSHLPKRWQLLFDTLRCGKTKITTKNPKEGNPTGDLAACRQDQFVPQPDGSLQLLRSPGYFQACEEAAAWMSSLPQEASRLVIWPDPGLDAALRRHGLPTLGAKSELQTNALLSILPLVLELARKPQDPNTAFELLLLPASPVRPGIARALAQALHVWQAVGSPQWNQALEQELTKISDPKERTELSKRLATIFTPTRTRTQRYPAKEINTRTALIENWTQGYYSNHQDQEDECQALFRQCAVLKSMIESCGVVDFSKLELNFLVKEATQAAAQTAVHPPQAGISSVDSPGAITGPVDYVLFWDFSLSRYSPPQTLPLSDAELGELFAFGVQISSASDLALQQASLFRRPLQAANKALLCVCPQRTRAGQEEYPHPAWDEIASRAKPKTHSVLEVETVIPARPLEKYTPRYQPPVKREKYFVVPANSLVFRKKESPSSLGHLLQCSFSYVLHYNLGIKTGISWPLPDPGSPLALGNLSHHLLALALQEVLDETINTIEQGEKRIGDLFDEQAPKLVSGLFLADNQDVCADVRAKLAHTIRDVLTLKDSDNLRVKAVEQHLETKALGIRVGGRVDLLLGDPTTVLDFKWSGKTSKRKSLEMGTAYQLAVYSYLTRNRKEKTYPAVGFYIVNDGSLLMSSQDKPTSATTVPGPNAEITWSALDRTAAKRFEEIRKGELIAPGNLEEPPTKDCLEDGFLVLCKKCDYCQFSALCGHWFGEQ